MKKISLLLSSIAFVLTVNAQREFVNSPSKMVFNPKASPKGQVVDTLIPQSFFTGSPALYSVGNSGYVAGTNGYGDMAKGQIYVPDTNITIEGVMIWVGANTLGENDGDLTVTIYDYAGEIGTAFSTKSVSFEQVTSTISTADFYFSVMFDEPATVRDSFAAVLSWNAELTDGFGIVSTSDLDAAGAGLSIEQWSDETWNSILEAWNLDIDLGIFPLVSYPTVSVNDTKNSLSNIQVYPNPFTDKVIIEDLTGANSVVFTNILGQQVMRLKAVENRVEVSTAALDNGIYFISITDATGKTETKKLIKE